MFINTQAIGGGGMSTGGPVDVATVATQSAAGESDNFELLSGTKSVQSVLTGTGAVSCDLIIKVSNDGTNFLDAGTISLTGIGIAFDGFTIAANWKFLRVSCTSITGTDASVTTFLSV